MWVKPKFCDNPNKKKKNEKQIKKYSREHDTKLSCSLLKLFIENYALLRNNEYKYSIPKQLEDMKNLYIDNNKDIIEDILLENFKLGTDDHTLTLQEIKNTFENYPELKNKELNYFTIIAMIKDLFEGVVYVFNSSIKGKKVKKTFHKLTFI